MCGFFGVIAPQPVLDAVREADVLQALRHRGPDDSGRFADRAPAGRPEGCLLLHARLSVLDVSTAARQPMTTADARWTIAYNGEIYNFAALRAELQAAGVIFRSQGDTEVLLNGLARHGGAFLRRLRGIFAFAAWDAATGTVLLARDPLGVKPLYYARCGSGLVFGSEVRALLASGLVDRTISSRGLADYLATGSVAEPNSIVANVRTLPPATILEHRAGVERSDRYWSLPTDTDHALTFDEAAEALRPVAREAIQSQLVSDVPLGVFLSGGLDSSSIVAHAAELGARLHTVSLAFNESAFDEGPIAQEVASRFGCTHRVLTVTVDEALGALPSVVNALDQPSIDGTNTYLVARAARQAGLTVALSGTGGDEVFAGYANAKRFGRYLAAGRIARPVSGLADSALRTMARLGRSGRTVAAARSILTAGGNPVQTYRTLRSLFPPEGQCALLQDEHRSAVFANDGRPASRARRASARRDPVNEYCRLELSGYLLNTLLRDTDVMSMAHSLEVRVPLLDHVLVEQVSRVPGRLKINSTTNKPLLQALTPQLPDAVVNRRKMGFTLPFDPWMRGRMRSWVEERLFDPSVSRLGLFEPTAVRSLWTDFLDSRTTWSRVWSVTTLHAWAAENLS